MNAAKKIFSILISEEDADFRFLYNIAVSEINSEIQINIVSNGEQVIEFLKKESIQRSLNREFLPNIIVVSLKSPFFTLDSLDEIRFLERFVSIPIYLFSNEPSAELRKTVISKGAKDLYRKPHTFHHLKGTLDVLIQNNMQRRLTKNLFCCRCEEFIEYDNDHGHLANQIKLSEPEIMFIKAKFPGALCIPCLNQLKTSFKILNGDFKNVKKFTHKKS